MPFGFVDCQSLLIYVDDLDVVDQILDIVCMSYRCSLEIVESSIVCIVGKSATLSGLLRSYYRGTALLLLSSPSRRSSLD